jgi:hypothetical protein
MPGSRCPKRGRDIVQASSRSPSAL